MLLRLNVSATLVAAAVVVLIQVVEYAPNSICGDAILTVKSYELPMFIVALNATLILAVEAFVFVRVNELRVSVDEIVIIDGPYKYCENFLKLLNLYYDENTKPDELNDIIRENNKIKFQSNSLLSCLSTS